MNTEFEEFIARQLARVHHRPLGECVRGIGMFVRGSYLCDFTPLAVLRAKWPEYEWEEVSLGPVQRGRRRMTPAELAEVRYHFMAFGAVYVVAVPREGTDEANRTDRTDEPEPKGVRPI